MFAAVCVLVAAAGHTVAAGTGLPLWALTAGFGVVCAGALALTGRERSLTTITGAVLVAQTGLHGLFAWSTRPATSSLPAGSGAGAVGELSWCGPHGDPAGPPPGVQPGSLHEAAAPSTVSAIADAAIASMGTAMLATHLVAALLTGWWLWRGEATVWSLLRRLAAAAANRLERLLAPFANTIVGTGRTGWRPAAAGLFPLRFVLRYTIDQRGPPVTARCR